MDWRIYLLPPFLSSVFLLLMFYFFHVLQYFLFLVILIVSFWAVFLILKNSLPLIPALFNYESNNAVINIISASMTILILIEWSRQNSYFLNNILCLSICANIMNSLRFHSLRLATVCLGGLVVYDIYWVFLSSRLFSTNVMVEVSTKEAESIIYHAAHAINSTMLKTFQPKIQLPLKLLVPIFPSSNAPYSHFHILGAGDVAIPGTLVSYLLEFDLSAGHILARQDSVTNTSAIHRLFDLSLTSYFYLSVAAYGLGLALALLLAHNTNHPQPALLYTIPTMLCTVIIAAYLRGEFALMWRGSRMNGILENE